MKNIAEKPVKPLNVKQERFAELVVSGMSATQAYIAAGYQVSGNAAEVNASRLLRHAQVRARITELRAPQTRAALLTKDEKRAFLAEILRTPIGEIGPDSPLCQEYSEDVLASGTSRGKLKRGKAHSGNEVAKVPVTRRKVRMADKLKAIELDSKLAGHFEPDQVVVEAGPKTLEAIEDRAAGVVSILDASRR